MSAGGKGEGKGGEWEEGRRGGCKEEGIVDW